MESISSVAAAPGCMSVTRTAYSIASFRIASEIAQSAKSKTSNQHGRPRAIQ
jgi:hypothetical protein